MSNNATQTKLFFQRVLNAGNLEILEDIVDKDYRVHVPDLLDLPVLENGIEPLRVRLRHQGRVPNTIKRVLVDGDLVLAHVRYHSDPDIAGADLFRFNDKGKIVEHWFTRQAVPAAVTDDSMFDGGGNPEMRVSPQALAANRARLEDTYARLFGQARYELVSEFYAPVYRQHNPHMPDGSERLATMLRTRGPVVANVFHIVAAGDLVAGHSFFRTQGLNDDLHSGDRTHAVDIFRIDANGQFAEHWDVLQMESNPLPNFDTFF